MSADDVKEILGRVLNWPAERQAEVARVVEAMELNDRSTLSLSAQQVAEVRRRAASIEKTIPAADVFSRVRSWTR